MQNYQHRPNVRLFDIMMMLCPGVFASATLSCTRLLEYSMHRLWHSACMCIMCMLCSAYYSHIESAPNEFALIMFSYTMLSLRWYKRQFIFHIDDWIWLLLTHKRKTGFCHALFSITSHYHVRLLPPMWTPTCFFFVTSAFFVDIVGRNTLFDYWVLVSTRKM